MHIAAFRRAVLPGLFLMVLSMAPAQDKMGAEDSRRRLVVGTFNVHYVADGQNQMSWENREAAFGRALEAMNADLVAFQEMETFVGGTFNTRNVQQEYIATRFPEYRFAATGNPEEFPNTQPIIYRKDRLRVIDEGFFFFSERPDVLYSEPWRGRWPSFATWGLFEFLPSGALFYIYNVHLDVTSIVNRRRSARLVGSRIENRDRPEVPVVLLGDFNAFRWFPAVREFRSLGIRPVTPRGATYHFYRGMHLFPAIDHILASPSLQPLRASIVRANSGPFWASDHYPVVVTFGM